MEQVLDGIRVLDFTDAVQGPGAIQYLGDFGADVVKVEPIRSGLRQGSTLRLVGSNARDSEGKINGVGSYFLAVNRNKRDILVDLKQPEGLEIIHRLVKEVDVVASNFRPGVTERLGIGYERLREINPRIIYAVASGFGQTGPYSRLKGQDLVAQGMGGIMALTGPEGSPPTAAGAYIADLIGGYHMAMHV